MEKKYQDQIRIIESECAKEKELFLVQSCHLRQDAEKQMGSMQEQMAKMRKNVAILEEVSVGIDLLLYFFYLTRHKSPFSKEFKALYSRQEVQGHNEFLVSQTTKERGVTSFRDTCHLSSCCLQLLSPLISHESVHSISLIKLTRGSFFIFT